MTTAHILAVSHVLSAFIAFALVSVIAAPIIARRRQRTGQRHGQNHAVRHASARRPATALRRWLADLVWLAVALVGWIVANRRYDVVAPALRPFEQSLDAANHRIGHAVCLPLPFRPHWLVRCRGCRAWILLREVPARQGHGVDLKVAHGSLYGAGPCPARYLSAALSVPATHMTPVHSATTDPSARR